jgi:hypothetical protein
VSGLTYANNRIELIYCTAEASILTPVPGTEAVWEVWSPETKNDIFENGEPLWPHTSMIDLHHTVGVSMSTFADMTLRI